jgi:hypothetical protein
MLGHVLAVVPSMGWVVVQACPASVQLARNVFDDCGPPDTCSGQCGGVAVTLVCHVQSLEDFGLTMPCRAQKHPVAMQGYALV